MRSCRSSSGEKNREGDSFNVKGAVYFLVIFGLYFGEYGMTYMEGKMKEEEKNEFS